MEKISLDEILPLVDANGSFSQNICLNGQNIKLTNFAPEYMPDSKLLNCCTTMSDLFALEPPRTFADCVHLQKSYEIKINFTYEFVGK